MNCPELFDIFSMLFVFQSCKAVYDRIIELRISTPQIIINYGMFLEENNYFEEAFKVRFNNDNTDTSLSYYCETVNPFV